MVGKVRKLALSAQNFRFFAEGGPEPGRPGSKKKTALTMASNLWIGNCARSLLGMDLSRSAGLALTRGLSSSPASTSAAAADKNAEAAAGGATSPPAYVTKEYLDNVRFRIFGTHIGNGLRSGRKVLRKNLIGDKVLAWYPQTEAYGKPHQGDKLWEDPDLFVAKDRLERYQRRGKGPPKKGAGKRASRKK